MIRDSSKKEFCRINICATRSFRLELTKLSAGFIGPGLCFVAQVRLVKQR
jgi:hypothetical protein